MTEKSPSTAESAPPTRTSRDNANPPASTLWTPSGSPSAIEVYSDKQTGTDTNRDPMHAIETGDVER